MGAKVYAVTFVVLLGLIGATEAAALKRRMPIRSAMSEEESQLQALRQLCATGWQSAVCKDQAMMDKVVAEHRAAQQKRIQEQMAQNSEEAEYGGGINRGSSLSIETNATSSRLIDGEIDTPTLVGPRVGTGKTVASGSGAHFLVPAAAACTFLGGLLFFNFRQSTRGDQLSPLLRSGSRRFRRRSSDDELRPLLPT